LHSAARGLQHLKPQEHTRAAELVDGIVVSSRAVKQRKRARELARLVASLRAALDTVPATA
jgi:hypothetical protein